MPGGVIPGYNSQGGRCPSAHALVPRHLVWEGQPEAFIRSPRLPSCGPRPVSIPTQPGFQRMPARARNETQGARIACHSRPGAARPPAAAVRSVKAGDVGPDSPTPKSPDI